MSQPKRLSLLILLIIALALLAGCYAPGPSPDALATMDAASTASALPSVAFTPEVNPVTSTLPAPGTATPAPSPTATASPSPSPAPSATPEPVTPTQIATPAPGWVQPPAAFTRCDFTFWPEDAGRTFDACWFALAGGWEYQPLAARMNVRTRPWVGAEIIRYAYGPVRVYGWLISLDGEDEWLIVHPNLHEYIAYRHPACSDSWQCGNLTVPGVP